MTGLNLPLIGAIFGLVLAVPLVLAAWRMIKGPGVADRFVALDMLTGVVVALAAITALITGRGAFLDVAVGVALVNFVATVALSAFLERKGEGQMIVLQILGLILVTIGVGFLVLAGVGVARLPDALQRMHASTKAGTLGASLVVIGSAMMLPDIRLSSVGFVIAFLLLTLPVAAQLLARAVYKSGTRLSLSRDDPLAAVIRREEAPLEERSVLNSSKDD